MRIVIAGAQAERVASLQRELVSHLPPHAVCIAWSSSTSIHASDVRLLIGLTGSDAPSQAVETQIRTQWAQAGVAFQVVYGEGVELANQARHALARAVQQRDPTWAASLMREEITPRWQGLGESCSDPDCEHRLFRRLLAS